MHHLLKQVSNWLETWFSFQTWTLPEDKINQASRVDKMLLSQYHPYIVERDGKTLLPQFLGMYRYHRHSLTLVQCTYNSMYIRLTVDNVENYMCVMRNVFSGHLKVRNLRRWFLTKWFYARCTRNTIWKGQLWRGRRARRKSRKRSQHWRCEGSTQTQTHIQRLRREKYIPLWRPFRTMTLSKMAWRSPSERRPRANWWKHSLQMFNSSSSRF